MVGMGALLFPGHGPGKPPRLHSRLQGQLLSFSSGSRASISTLKASCQPLSLLGGKRQFKKRPSRANKSEQVKSTALGFHRLLPQPWK